MRWRLLDPYGRRGAWRGYLDGIDEICGAPVAAADPCDAPWGWTWRVWRAPAAPGEDAAQRGWGGGGGGGGARGLAGAGGGGGATLEAAQDAAVAVRAVMLSKAAA